MKSLIDTVLRLIVTFSLLLISNVSLAYIYYIGNEGWGLHSGGATFYYHPGYYPRYYYPYVRRPYLYPRTIIYPVYPNNTINTCPLMPSYYDANGNWVPATRVCAY